jgi:AraC family transcriptional activator of pobA
LLHRCYRPFDSATGVEVTVLTMQEAQCGLGQYDRRDVFKCVMVLQRANELHYATRSYAIDRLALCVR